jgi:protease IV
MTARAFFSGLWRGLDGLRRALHLILLLVIFGALVGVLRGSVPLVPGRAALVIAPEGPLVEQLSGDPRTRALDEALGNEREQALLWDLKAAIRAAAGDKRIQVLALDLDKLESATQPDLAELAAAIREFRASGKKVIAYGVELTQERYYIAAQADEIYLDPMGFVLVEGYDRYRTYLKDALDKLGVDINVFRVGQFKSAVETYTRTSMSPEDREESRAYLTALWNAYQQEVTRARKLAPDALAKYTDSFMQTVPAAQGDAAKVALSDGLVTGLKTQLEVEQRLTELVGPNDEGDSFSGISSADYLRGAKVAEKLSLNRQKVGVIVAAGEILDGEQPPGTIGGDSTAHLIREARTDKDVKALVLRVDSPGGSVLASEEIYRELVALRAAGKPLIVSMGGYAASGGYYISAPADEIFAHPATITGSIGIFAIIPTVDKTLGKVGVSTDGVGTTALSGQLRIDRPLSEGAKAVLQSVTTHGYDEFLERVASGRKKSRDEINTIAQGRVWAGVDAKRVGLVDELGSFDDAVQAAARRAKLTTWSIKFIEPKLTWAETLAMNLKGALVRMFVHASPDQAALRQLAQRFDPVTHQAALLSRFSQPNRLYAYCFCEVH